MKSEEELNSGLPVYIKSENLICINISNIYVFNVTNF
jgi:hypothetical protein